MERDLKTKIIEENVNDELNAIEYQQKMLKMQNIEYQNK